ncbi:MAG: thioredoxin family protein [Alphaproteobacteria bacterium]|nr:thioredoxin family protein [Alphaproteobacteria bacterium]
MALTHTPAPECGTPAPHFSLQGTDNKTYTLDDIRGEKGTLVMFICNHCPYVKTIVSRIVADMKDLQAAGLGVVAIMPNDTSTHPADSFDNMKIFANTHGFTFPYLIDETQEVAKAYGAVCTPDFFGYGADGTLLYRGRLDEVNPSKPATPDTKHELRDAMLHIAQTGTAPDNQIPSMGCSIKWKPQNAA